MIHFRIAHILSNLDFSTVMKTLHIKASKLCDKLFRLERQGLYEEALSEVGDLWQDKTALPEIEGLPARIGAEFLLRCGSLFGFLGHNKQIPNSQEKSRNLITRARNMFIEFYDVEKIAECENYLALSYWRTGEINEATIWLDESFSHNLSPSNHTRIYTYIIKGLVLFSAEQYAEILNLLKPIEKHIRKCTDVCLNGAFYNLIGNCRENLGDVSGGLKILELAKDCYQKGGHQVYYAVLLNDLAFLYQTCGDFDKAHQTIDASTKTFKKIKDRSREGFSLDTKALIYYSQSKFKEALSTIEKAIKILTPGENTSYVVETYGTKIKILISMDDITAATFCLIEAVQIAKTQISEARAESLIKEYEASLRRQLASPKEILPDAEIAEDTQPDVKPQKEDVSLDGIELILPSPLSNFKDIQGVWINNTHLENAGLTKDSLAVVVPAGEVKRGDLIALEEIEDQNVSCGFYDNEFGIVCLEGGDGEPLLFDETKIRILGKIVGVATERTPDGKLIVEPL